MSYRENLVAVDAGDGYDIFTKDGAKTDHCSSEPGELTRFARCTGGWEGPLFFSGKDVSDATPGEIMALQNDVWFLACMPDLSKVKLSDFLARILTGKKP